MFNIGIIVYNKVQLDEMTKFITDYLHCTPHHKLSNGSEWQLPLVNISVIIYSITRGHKFDFLYYDERIEQEYIYEVLFPCCHFGKPIPLKQLLSKISI